MVFKERIQLKGGLYIIHTLFYIKQILPTTKKQNLSLSHSKMWKYFYKSGETSDMEIHSAEEGDVQTMWGWYDDDPVDHRKGSNPKVWKRFFLYLWQRNTVETIPL